MSTAPSTRVAAAYAVCERVTAEQAANFAWGIRLLGPTGRRAMSAVYALARRIDDIGDAPDPAPDRRARLAAVRAELAQLRGDLAAGALPAAPGPTQDSVQPWRTDPVLLAVADAAVRTHLPLQEFDELLDGCEADVAGRRYATFEELRGYTRQVAGSIGRLSVAVFTGGRPADGLPLGPLADAMGTALQLTNIVRDIREDAAGGRVYLPAEDLARFGTGLEVDSGGRLTDDPAALRALVCWELARAAEWYRVSDRLPPLLDRRGRACCAALSGVYRALHARMAADPGAVLTGRTRVPTARKVVVAARSLASMRRSAVRPVGTVGTAP